MGAPSHSGRVRGAEAGATSIEYALIAALISVFIVGSLTLMSNSMTGMYNFISSTVVSATGN
ncbi:MAG TPA: Flp family type IVb pilin [Candidatus Cybelea sp.]|nr:Flp family type IVb pilin [Candidatus Cybelea sp.]